MPFLFLVLTNKAFSQISICTSIVWEGEGLATLFRDYLDKLDIHRSMG